MKYLTARNFVGDYFSSQTHRHSRCRIAHRDFSVEGPAGAMKAVVPLVEEDNIDVLLGHRSSVGRS